jgi:hypothetical protein
VFNEYILIRTSLSVWRYRPIWHRALRFPSFCINLLCKHLRVLLPRRTSGFYVHWTTNTQEKQTYMNFASGIQTYNPSIQETTHLTRSANCHNCTHYEWIESRDIRTNLIPSGISVLAPELRVRGRMQEEWGDLCILPRLRRNVTQYTHQRQLFHNSCLDPKLCQYSWSNAAVLSADTGHVKNKTITPRYRPVMTSWWFLSWSKNCVKNAKNTSSNLHWAVVMNHVHNFKTKP